MKAGGVEDERMSELLELMLSDTNGADRLYLPTNFWSSGLRSILEDLRQHGFARFREHPSAAVFYVPMHSRQVWRKHEPTVKRLAGWVDGLLARKGVNTRLSPMLDGTYAAYDDYRLFVAADDPSKKPHLDGLSESTVGGGERFSINGSQYGKSFLNYLRGLAFLKRNTDTSDLTSILEIGGGYGSLGEILLQSVADGFYVNVDIPPLAAVSTHYLREIFGKDAVLAYDQSRSLDRIDLNELRKSYRAVVLCSWQLPKVVGCVDTFVNFMSFQEMEPDVVENYARLVQPLTANSILVRNSVHGKPVAKSEQEIGVFEPTTTDMVVGMFDQFRTVARDSTGFGEESPDRRFRSEVTCLARNAPLEP